MKVKKDTFADQLMEAREVLISLEDTIADKILAATDCNIEMFDFVDYDYDEQYVVFTGCDNDFSLTSQQQNVLWEFGFLGCVLEFERGAELYTPKLDSLD